MQRRWLITIDLNNDRGSVRRTVLDCDTKTETRKKKREEDVVGPVGTTYGRVRKQDQIHDARCYSSATEQW